MSHFQDLQVDQLKMDESIPFVWLAASIGGVLCLFMGSSVVTIFEIGYFCLLW